VTARDDPALWTGRVGTVTPLDRFDYENFRLMVLHNYDAVGLEPGQADKTAALADRHRARGQRLTLCAVAMPAVVLVLTVARQVRRRRAVLLTAAGLGFLATVVVPVVTRT